MPQIRALLDIGEVLGLQPWTTETEKIEAVTTLVQKTVNDLTQQVVPDPGLDVDPVVGERIRGLDMTWRRLGQILYNPDASDKQEAEAIAQEKGIQGYAGLIEYAKREAKFFGSPETFSDRTAALREKIAEKLLRLVSGGVDTATSLPKAKESDLTERPRALPVGCVAARLVGATPYVRRTWYHDQVRALIDKKHRVIALVGDSGDGKTRLALEIAHEGTNSPEGAVFLDCSSAETISQSLIGIITAEQRYADDSNLNEIRAFWALISRPDGPSYVVLDNLVDKGLLKSLVPPDHLTTLLITTTEQAVAHGFPSVVVTAMQQDTACELVRTILPSVTDADASRLAASLGGRALAIVQVCGFLLAEQLMTIPQFLSELEANAAETLDLPAAIVDYTLPAVYEQTMLSLEDTNPAAARLLEFLAFLSPTRVPINLLKAALALATDNSDVARSVARGLIALRARYLVQVVDAEVTVHHLTHDILQGILSGKRAEVSRILHEVAYSDLARVPVGFTIPRVGLRTIAAIGEVLGNADYEADPDIAAKLDHIVALYSRSFRQLGLNLYTALGGVPSIKIFGTTLHYIFPRGLDEQLIAGKFRETGIEWPATLYAAGRISSHVYVGLVAHAIGLVRADDQSAYLLSLEIPYVLAYAEALIAHGSMQQAQEVLQPLESRFRNRKLSGPEVGWLGTCKVLLGESLLAHGDVRLAAAQLDEAFYIFKEFVSERDMATTGAINALRVLLRCTLIGADPEGVQTIWDYAIECWKAQPDGFIDTITSARFQAIQGRIAAAYLAIRHWQDAVVDDPWAPDQQAVDDATGALWRAGEAYAACGWTHECSDLPYDHAIAEVVAGRGIQLHDDIVGMLRSGAESDASMFAVLGYVKGLLLSSHMSEHAANYAARLLLAFAYDVGMYHESLYWYCEALATARACAVVAGLKGSDYVEAHIKEGYAKMDRMGRFEALESAIAAYPGGRDFQVGVSYLLTY